MLINMKVFYKLIALFLIGLPRHAQSTLVIFATSCDAVRELTSLASSNIALTTYHISNVLPPLTLVFS